MIAVSIVIVVSALGIVAGISAQGASGRPACGELARLAPYALVAPLVLVIGIVSIARMRLGGWGRWYRIDGFARANGMTFAPRSPDPAYPGSIFGIGRDRARSSVTTAADRFLDYGNYTYTTGSGKNRSTRVWGFLALQLDRALPHMVPVTLRANNAVRRRTCYPVPEGGLARG